MVKTLQGPHLITTSPSIMKCRNCHRMVLAVTINGMDRHVDPTALNDAGELAALLDGRKSYELHSNDQLIKRTVSMIANPHRTWPVMADHACTGLVPDSHQDHSVMGRAVALVTSLLGVEMPLPDQAPF